MTQRTAGRQAVAGGSHAWIQPDGGWGLSNAGVVVSDKGSVLVDTLFDLPRTAAMLDGLASVLEGHPLRAAVNTHGNGDHWFGNELLADDVEVIAAEGTVADMRSVGPQTVAGLLEMPGPVGDFGRQIFGDFELTGITPRYPDTSYTEEHVVQMPGVDLLLLDVGPAHTSADTVVFCERDGVVFTGDIVFAGGTPIVWEGPVDNWLRACARIVELGASHLVPGHGPISPVAAVHQMTDYLETVREEAALRYERGMTVHEAACDIDLGRFASLPEAERLAANVATVYRELEPVPPAPLSGPEMFGCMAALRDHWDRRATSEESQR